jgi:glycosyltransferase involved in cell wall biosynthesis
MRVLFPDLSSASSGRGFFLQALAKELPCHDVEVVYDGEHDVSLHAIRMWCKTKKPRILRLDGIYHDTGKDWRAKNEGLKQHAAAADGVVCQSDFSKQMVMRYLDVPEEKVRVIFNGASVRIPGTYDKNLFLAVSKWRPHKRLQDIIGAFMLADLNDAMLCVCGDTEKTAIDAKKYGSSVKFMGHYEHDDLWALFGHAAASIHLCWFDACPNSVVEAIVAGCPVICNNTGGTNEIVRPSGGIVLDLDTPYDYGPVDLYHPPAIDRYKVAQAIRKCAERRPVITSDHVDIKNIAMQYKAYFERFV